MKERAAHPRPLCSKFHRASELIGRRWTGAIIFMLMESRCRFASFRKRTAWSTIRPARLDDDYKPPGDHKLIGRIKSPPLQAHGPFEETTEVLKVPRSMPI